MTNCTSNTLSFSPLSRKKVEGNFAGGCITSDAGGLLLREVDKKCNLLAPLGKLMSDQRHQGYVNHSVGAMLKQRVYAIALGYEDVNDHDHLRKDLAFQTMVGREVNLASSATLSRFENSATRADCIALSQQIVEQFITSKKTAPKELILDFDPTDNRIYGKQEGRHYHGYYKNYCFLPLYVFCGDELLVSYLRPCDIDGAKHAGAILKLLVKRFREVWPEVRIVFRGDGAFARKRILYWCENNDVEYIVGISGNARLKKEVAAWSAKAEKQFSETGEAQKLFTDFHYSAKSWHTQRRVICKAEHNEYGSNLRFILSSEQEEDPELLYSERYCMRGEMENKLKQLKLDLESDRLSCSDFIANQFRILLSSLAYMLIHHLREHGLKGTTFAKAYCGTIRLKLLKVGAVILKNTRSIRCYFSSYYEQQGLFINILAKLTAT
jgi:hypothetical protein